MARPPLALGHHGSFRVTRDRGQWVARCRFRDLDGVTRRVARWGSSKTAAQQAIQDELRERRGEQTEILRADSRFREAAVVWMRKIRERRRLDGRHLRPLPSQTGPPPVRRAAPA